MLFEFWHEIKYAILFVRRKRNVSLKFVSNLAFCLLFFCSRTIMHLIDESETATENERKKTTLFTYRENWYDGRPKIYIIFASLLFAFVSVYSFHCVFSTKTKWFRSGLRYIIAQSYNKRFCGFKLTISLNSTSWKIFLCHFSSNFGKQIIF